jgi:lipoprotein-anchoring transpeptidase ErfK/SrfK
MYAALTDNSFVINGLDLSHIDPNELRHVVDNPTGKVPGTIVVNTDERRLYLTLEGGQAMRDGIWVGKEGLAWSGRATIRRNAAWPRWRPTVNMIRRDPRNAEWAHGMDGGFANPLCARALTYRRLQHHLQAA